MTKKDLNRVVSAYHAGVSIDVCIGMILDINVNRCFIQEGAYDMSKFKAECQQDIPKFLCATGEITS